MTDLKVDPDRAERFADSTGIYCRALRGDRWDSVDVAELDRASLIEFVESRGPVTPWARDIVLILLNHDRAGL